MELLHAAFSPVNLPYTIMMAIILLYWLSVVIGVLDLSSFDVDLDLDADVDASGAFHGLLAFMNLAELPLMFVLSVMVTSMWAISLLSNHYLQNGAWSLALAVAIPNILVSLLITKIFTRPFAKFFRSLSDEPAARFKIIGNLCVINADLDSDRIAQAEIKTEGAPLLITIRARKGAAMTKGSQGLIVDKDSERDIYIVEPFNDWES